MSTLNGKGKGKFPGKQGNKGGKPIYKKGGNDNNASQNKKDCGNPMEFYSKNPTLLEAAAQIATGIPRGQEIDLGSVWITSHNSGEGVNSTTYHTFGAAPRARRGSVNQCVIENVGGSSLDGGSPTNVATVDIYSWVRHYNSGSRNYEAPDLFIQLASLTECYGFAAWVKRLIRISTYVDPYDKSTPKALFAASFSATMAEVFTGSADLNLLSRQYGDFVKDKINLDTWLTTFVNRLQTFCLPNKFYPAQLAVWYNSHVFTDDQVNEHLNDYYVFTPVCFKRFEATAYKTGGALIPCLSYPGRTLTDMSLIEGIIAYGEYLLSGLMDQEDAGIISGDIRKAYGEDLFTIQNVIDVNDPFTLSYDHDTLLRIHNASITPTDMGIYDLNKYDSGVSPSLAPVGEVHRNLRLEDSIGIASCMFQLNGKLISTAGYSTYWDFVFAVDPEDVRTCMPIYTGHTLDYPNEKPSIQELVESTRLTTVSTKGVTFPRIHSEGNLQRDVSITTFSSDYFVMVNYVVIKYDGVSDSGDISLSLYSPLYFQPGNTYAGFDIIKNVYFILSANYSPKVLMCERISGWSSSDAEDRTVTNAMMAWETHNIVPTPDNYLINLHEVCLLSEFNVPNYKNKV